MYNLLSIDTLIVYINICCSLFCAYNLFSSCKKFFFDAYNFPTQMQAEINSIILVVILISTLNASQDDIIQEKTQPDLLVPELIPNTAVQHYQNGDHLEISETSLEIADSLIPDTSLEIPGSRDLKIDGTV